MSRLLFWSLKNFKICFIYGFVYFSFLFFLSSCQTISPKGAEGEGQLADQSEWAATTYVKVFKKGNKKRSSYLNIRFRSLGSDFFSMDVSLIGLGIPLARVVKNKKKITLLLLREKKQYMTENGKKILKKLFKLNLGLDVFHQLLLRNPLNAKNWDCSNSSCRHRQMSLVFDEHIEKNGERKWEFKGKNFEIEMNLEQRHLKRALTPEDFLIKPMKSFKIYQI